MNSSELTWENAARFLAHVLLIQQMFLRVSPPFELPAKEGEKSLPLLVPSVPERFQCQRGAVRRAVARVEVVFLGVVAGKGIANAAIAPTKPPKMTNSRFWFVHESTTPPMLIVWREPAAKASFLAKSDRRRLGTTIPAMNKVIATSISS